jgi:hypothetical protein
MTKSRILFSALVLAVLLVFSPTLEAQSATCDPGQIMTPCDCAPGQINTPCSSAIQGPSETSTPPSAAPGQTDTPPAAVDEAYLTEIAASMMFSIMSLF